MSTETQARPWEGYDLEKDAFRLLLPIRSTPSSNTVALEGFVVTWITTPEKRAVYHSVTLSLNILMPEGIVFDAWALWAPDTTEYLGERPYRHGGDQRQGGNFQHPFNTTLFGVLVSPEIPFLYTLRFWSESM